MHFIVQYRGGHIVKRQKVRDQPVDECEMLCITRAIYTIMIIIHIFSLFSQEDDPSFLETLLYFLGLEKRVYKCRSGNDVWKVCLIHTYPLPFHKWRLRCQSLDLHLYGLKPIYMLLILKLSNAKLTLSFNIQHTSFIYIYVLYIPNESCRFIFHYIRMYRNL